MKKQLIGMILALVSGGVYADDFAVINKTVVPLSLWANQARCAPYVEAKTAILYVANYITELCSDNPTNCDITVHESKDCTGEAVASVKLVDGKLTEVSNISPSYFVYGDREQNIVSFASASK